MKTILVGKKVVKLYDSIDELPIVNYQKYNKCLLLDSGIGSDTKAIGGHISRIAQLINADSKEKAIQELQNMYHNLFMIINEVSPSHLAFAAMVHSIDGKIVTELSDNNLTEILKQLKGLRHSTVIRVLEWLKKKLTAELEVYFPEDFLASAKEKTKYSYIIRRTNLMLDEVISGTSHDNEITKLEETLLSWYNPKTFMGKNSAEVLTDKQFETACMVIAQETGLKAKEMKVLEFYSILSNIQKQTEAKLKAYKKK